MFIRGHSYDNQNKRDTRYGKNGIEPLLLATFTVILPDEPEKVPISYTPG